MIKTEKNLKHRSLTTEKVVTKAMEIADEQGIEALSMRKLASAFNVTAMSLYNHVAGKDDLLDLMLGHVVTEFEIPDTNGDWQDMMRHRAHSMRRALLRHPWAATLLISRITLGRETMRDIDATVGCLVTAGFTYGQADWARNAIDSHIYGYTLQELNFPVAPDEYRAAAARYLPMISESDYPFMHEAATQVSVGKYDGMTQFYFGLDLILDGLQRWLDEPISQTNPTPQSGQSQ